MLLAIEQSESLKFLHRVLGPLKVVIGDLQPEFFKRDTMITVLLTTPGVVGHLGKPSNQFLSVIRVFRHVKGFQVTEHHCPVTRKSVP